MTVIVIILGVFAALMALRGFKKGFAGRIITLVCMILAFGLMIYFAPLVKSTITDRTDIDEKTEQRIEQKLEKKIPLTDGKIADTAKETAAKTAQAASAAVITAASYVLSFLAFFVILRLICRLIFGHIKKNKVVKGTDALLGGIFGLAEALLIIEGIFLLLKLLSGVPAIDTFVTEHLTKSAALSYIYQHNLLDFLNSLRYNSYS